MRALTIHDDHLNLSSWRLRRAAWRAGGDRHLRGIDRIWHYCRHVNTVTQRKAIREASSNPFDAMTIKDMVRADLQKPLSS